MNHPGSYIRMLTLVLCGLSPIASQAPPRQALEINLDCAGGDCLLLKGKPPSAGMRSGVVRLKPGESVGWHSTEQNEESLVILHGKGSAFCEGLGNLAFFAPQIIYIPPATKHNIENTDAELLEYVYVVAPARE